MSDWKIETAQGEAVLAHSEDRGHIVNSERADIEAAERRANTAGRTIVFVRLFTDGGMSYYYPVQFLPRLTEFPRLAVGPGSGFRLWTDPRYRQRPKPFPTDNEVDYTDGTVPLPDGFGALVTSRGYPLPVTAEAMAAAPWFSLWQRRLWPYRELEAGDTLYWYDATEQAVVWESRVSRVERFEYDTKEAVRQWLRAVFDDPHLSHPYLDKASDKGYCLAYRVDRVRPVRVTKPAGFRFPQDGWLRCDDEAAREWASQFLHRTDPDGPAAADLLRAGAAVTGSDYFSPAPGRDERERVLREIVQRRGQSEFRTRLLAAYGGRCAITGCDAAAALEAAHLDSYSGPATQHIANGLLLRADLHTLFDLDLIGIDPDTLTVALAPAIRETVYASLHGVQLRCPADPADGPDRKALTCRWQRFLRVEPQHPTR